MSTTLVFVGVLVFGFIVARFASKLGAERTGLSGIEFLAVGLLLGPVTAPRVLTHEVLDALELFISMLIGLIGFLAGLGLRRVLRNFEIAMAGAASSAAVIAVVAIGASAAVQAAHPELLASLNPVFSVPIASTETQILTAWLSPEALWVGVALASAAGVSSATTIAKVAKLHGVTARRSEVLLVLASAGQAVAVVGLGVAMAASRATANAGALGLTIAEWGLVVVGFGAVSGLMFSVYLGREEDSMRMTLAAIGAVTFSAGAGTALKVSPLFVNLAAGAVVGLSSAHADKLEAALRPLEYPVSVLVLLFAGAYWSPVSGWIWFMPLGYVVLRWMARRVATKLAVATFVAEPGMDRGIGRGLLGHGVLAAALALGFAMRFPDYSGVVLTTVLGGMLLTDVLAAGVTRRFFADSGDIVPGRKVK